MEYLQETPYTMVTPERNCVNKIDFPSRYALIMTLYNYHRWLLAQRNNRSTPAKTIWPYLDKCFLFILGLQSQLLHFTQAIWDDINGTLYTFQPSSFKDEFFLLELVCFYQKKKRTLKNIMTFSESIISMIMGTERCVIWRHYCYCVHVSRKRPGSGPLLITWS